ncbi:MAG: hypothetical protein WAV10_02155 [Minisyncoccia bacterium]
MKKTKRTPIIIDIFWVKKLISVGGGRLLENGTGYEASVKEKELCFSSNIRELFKKIFFKTHKKTFYHDIILNFPDNVTMSYSTLQSGQLLLTHKYKLSEKEREEMFKELFEVARLNDIPPINT